MTVAGLDIVSVARAHKDATHHVFAIITAYYASCGDCGFTVERDVSANAPSDHAHSDANTEAPSLPNWPESGGASKQ